MTFVLPVSGATVGFRAPSGHDELVLGERPGSGAELRVELVQRLAPLCSAESSWTTLPYVDVDAALLGVRQFLLGDRLVAEIQCGECQSWGDLAFSVYAYLDRSGTRRKHADPDLFARIPTVDQVLSATRAHGTGASAAAALERACLAELTRDRAPVVAARLERLAPVLGRTIEGQCPSCHETLSTWFDPGAFVIAELRPRALGLLDEVHLLASRYGWSEDAVLSLPSPRRAAYAERIAHESRAS